MSEEIELKPCPYCRGEAEAHCYEDWDWETMEYSEWWQVGCSNQECPFQPCSIPEWFGNKEEAAHDWNTRPLEEELERTIAALVDAVQFALQSADFAANMNAREAEARLRALIGETP